MLMVKRGISHKSRCRAYTMLVKWESGKWIRPCFSVGVIKVKMKNGSEMWFCNEHYEELKKTEFETNIVEE